MNKLYFFILLLLIIFSSCYENETQVFIDAVKENDLENVKHLIEEGVDINSIDSNGCSALILASSYGYTEMVKLILSHDADISIKDSEGKTAYDYSKENNHDEISYILICTGDEVNTDYWVTNENGVILREGPDENSSEIKLISFGKDVRVLFISHVTETASDKKGNWCFVNYALNYAGWLFSADITNNLNYFNSRISGISLPGDVLNNAEICAHELKTGKRYTSEPQDNNSYSINLAPGNYIVYCYTKSTLNYPDTAIAYYTESAGSEHRLICIKVKTGEELTNINPVDLNTDIIIGDFGRYIKLNGVWKSEESYEIDGSYYHTTIQFCYDPEDIIFPLDEERKKDFSKYFYIFHEIPGLALFSFTVNKVCENDNSMVITGITGSGDKETINIRIMENYSKLEIVADGLRNFPEIDGVFTR